MARRSEKSKLRAQRKQEEKEQYDLVRQAQSKSDPLSEFSAFQKYDRNGVKVLLEYKEISHLDPETRKWILDLEKRNMEPVYNGCSWGWKDSQKVSELLDSGARYLIARENGKPVAFSHFRFDMDYGDAVLYCYELQLEENVRRKGLGKFMLQLLELVAFKNNMRKIILTVLKHNKSAVDFFYSLGYNPDETNPVENLYEEVPYEILSKINKRQK